MANEMSGGQREVSDLPSPESDEGTQLAVLLDTARELVSQEIDRGERFEGRSRNQFAVLGGLFAVVMATTAGILNLLVANHQKPQGWVYPVVGSLAAVSVITLGVAFCVSLSAWRTRKVDALDPTTIRDYIPHAEKGRVAVVKHLVDAYAGILADRRAKNDERLAAFKNARFACVVAAIASLLQLSSVFAAIILK